MGTYAFPRHWLSWNVHQHRLRCYRLNPYLERMVMGDKQMLLEKNIALS